MVLTLFVAASFILVSLLLQTEWKGRQLARMTCEQLMAELKAVKMENIALVAVEYPSLCHRESGIDVWQTVGGCRGLLRMYTNTGPLLALAEQARAWDSRASTVALEHMRNDLLSVRRAALSSLYKRAFPLGREADTSSIHEAVNAYYGMTECLMTLYEQSPSRLYTRLDVALGGA